MTIDLRACFGFHSTPFTRELRAGEYFSLPFFKEASDGLLRCVEARMSGALIAPPGSGKTALVRQVIEELSEARYRTNYVKVTDLSKRDICREIAYACGVSPAGSYPALVRRLQEGFETTSSVDGLRPVLILDEAHDLRPDVLGMLRVLTNFQMDSRLVLSVLLCGQPPLKALLARDEQEAVARRLFHYATLRPLTREELSGYLTHRCTVAGAKSFPFDQGATDAIFEISRGNLRAADSLALKSLQKAGLLKLKVAGSGQVLEARKELWP